MSDASNVAKSLRERLGGNTEDRLGKALSELLENPLLTGAIGRAFDAREKASQAQEVAMGALNIPSAADIERLTRRLRAVSHRLEGIEDGVDRLDRALTPSGVEARLTAIEASISSLSDKLDGRSSGLRRPASGPPRRPPPGRARPPRNRRVAAAGRPGNRRVPNRSGRRKRRKPGPAARRKPRNPPKRRKRRPGDRGRDAPHRAKPDSCGLRAGLSPTGRRSPRRPSARPTPAAAVLDAPAGAVRVERVGDGQHAADRHRPRGAEREQRRRLHLDRQPAAPARPRPLLVEEVDADHGARRRVRTPARAAPRSALGRRRPARPRRARARCRPRRSPRVAITSSPSSRLGASAPQVPTRIARRAPSAISSVQHDRRRRAAHAGGLDRQRLAVRAPSPCSPTGRGGG